MPDSTPERATIALDGNAGQLIRVLPGSRGVWRLTYRAGARVIRPGGGVRVWRATHKFWLGMVKQTADPAGEDFCAAGSDGPPVEVCDVPPFYKRLAEGRVRVLAPGLQPGESLWFTCGTPGLPATVPQFAQRRVIYYLEVDYEGTGDFTRLEQPLVVVVEPGPATRLTLVAPSVIEPHEPFTLKLRAEDAESNPHARYTGTIRLQCEAPDSCVPPEVSLLPVDDGWRLIEGCSLGAEGIWRIEALAEGLPRTLSNPVRCERDPGHRVFWGDMHNHTQWCDGTDTVEYVYRFARDRAFLDVCACTEHIGDQPPDWPIELVDMPPGSSTQLWAEQARLSGAYNRLGSFVTFLGYEFTPLGGGAPANADHCVWFLDDRHPLVLDRDIEELGRMLVGQDAFIAPHVGGRYTQWNYTMPAQVMPVVEIASMHEHSEYFAQQSLSRGLRLGIVGMSDGHMGCPGYDIWPRHGRSDLHKRAFSCQSAITAFLSPQLDRPGIWAALGQRLVYATTGARILLDFVCLNAPGGEAGMGQEVSLSEPPCFRVEVHGTAPLDRVQIIRGDRLAQTWELSPASTGGQPAWDALFEWTDDVPAAGEAYYYVRVTQSDNHFAWSSPIWATLSGDVATGEAGGGKGPALPPWNNDVWPPVRADDPDLLPQIRACLARERCGERFVDLEQVGVFAESRGRYVLVRCRDAEREMRPTHIHYYLGFPDERLYVSAGWADYGQMPNQ